jgi:NAD(P)-dependent dehydrogenase (short-subunit alcohol dehydrogenase family)
MTSSPNSDVRPTAELVTAAGGRGIPVRVDHTEPADVKKLVAGIKRRHKGLDILVNDAWGGDALTEFPSGRATSITACAC